MTIAQQLHNSKFHKAGIDPACPVCNPTVQAPPDRKRVASSHGGKFSYWQDANRYIYQRNEITHQWIGWFCSLPAWESTLSKSAWITLEASHV